MLLGLLLCLLPSDPPAKSPACQAAPDYAPPLFPLSISIIAQPEREPMPRNTRSLRTRPSLGKIGSPTCIFPWHIAGLSPEVFHPLSPSSLLLSIIDGYLTH